LLQSFQVTGLILMFRSHTHPLVLLLAFSSTAFFFGCSGGSTPRGPEVGSVQSYLDEHPEALEDEPIESEDVEFEVAGEE